VRVVRSSYGKGASSSGWQDPTLSKAPSVLFPLVICIDYRLRNKVWAGAGRPPSPAYGGELKYPEPGLELACYFEDDAPANPHY